MGKIKRNGKKGQKKTIYQYLCMYVFKKVISMLYYVVYKNDAYDIILESFSSRDAADRFMATMKFWFSRPLQIIELTRNRKVVRTPAGKPT
jgi:hypothetical protein